MSANLRIALLIILAGSPALRAAPPEETPGYVIGPNDKIEVFVWKQTDLSQSVEVGPDGRIQYPLIGSIQAAGLSPEALADSIARGLASYVVEPKVTVIPRDFERASVYVIGRVKSAGRQNYRPGARLTDYLSEAGGPVDEAALDQVTITRNTGGDPVNLTVNVERILTEGDPAADLELKEGDIVYVPQAFSLVDTRLLILSVSGVIGIALGLTRIF